MENKLGQEILDLQRRREFLMDNCDKVEEKGYTKRYSEEELVAMKNKLTNLSIQVNDLEMEKKEIMKEFKVKLDPLKEEKLELIDGLKTKANYVTENCYKFIDQDNRQVGYYNSEGDLIDVRPAGAEELQTNIFQLTRKAN